MFTSNAFTTQSYWLRDGRRITTENQLHAIDGVPHEQHRYVFPLVSSDITMTSVSPGVVVDVGDGKSTSPRTICCDVTPSDDRAMAIFKSITVSRSARNNGDRVTSDTDATTLSTSSDQATSTPDANDGGVSAYTLRNCSTEWITTGAEPDVTATSQNMKTTSRKLETITLEPQSRVTKGLRFVAGEDKLSHRVTSSSTNRSTGKTSYGSSDLHPTSYSNASLSDFQTISINASRDHSDFRLPLALRSSADNASMSAAIGTNTADRYGGSGLLREEVATVSAAVAGVAVFWSLLAFTMCAVVRMRKRKHRQRMSGRLHADVDAQTAMMEAMVRAELARGRSRVSDSRVPTYVNVSELIPRSSSSCDLDMSDFFHFVLDNQSDFHGVWKKQRYNDVTSGRPRDLSGLPIARWHNGGRSNATCVATTHRPHNRRRANGRQDDYCLLNGTKDAANSGHGQQQCNGLLTKVKSLDSVCQAADEVIVDGKYRQRARRKRRYGVRRSASTSRCLVSTNKQTSSLSAPANGDVSKSDLIADDDVICQVPVLDRTKSTECATKMPQPDTEDQTKAVHRVDSVRSVDNISRTMDVGRHCEKMVLPEVSSLGDREPGVVSSSTLRDVFTANTSAVFPQFDRFTHASRNVGPPPLRRLEPPYRVMTSAVRPPYTDRLPRLPRYAPPPPPPPPPLPGHVMRLFVTSSNSKSAYPALSASVAGTAGRAVRFPRMGQTGLGANSHRATLQVVRPDRFQL